MCGALPAASHSKPKRTGKPPRLALPVAAVYDRRPPMNIKSGHRSRSARTLWWVVTACALAAVAATLGVWFLRQREPVYNGRPVSAYMLELGSTDKKVHDAAREAITTIGPKSVPFLIKVLDSKEESTERRSRSAMALGALGKDAKEAAPSLINAVDEKEFNLRNAALYALGRMPADPAKTVPLYQRLLNDPNKQIRYRVVFNLGRVRGGGESVLNALKTACLDKDKKVRMTATNSLADLGVAAAPEKPDDGAPPPPPAP